MDYGGGFDESDTARAGLLDRAHLPLGDTLEDTARDAWMHNPVQEGFDWLKLQAATQAGEQIPFGPGMVPNQNDIADPTDLNARYGDIGLHFDHAVPQSVADMMAARKLEENRLNAELARAPSGAIASPLKFATSLAVSAIDPLNVAASFVPVVGEARAALWAERFGTTLSRVGVGAIEGGTGAALLEPIRAANENAYQGNYGAMDAFLNVAFGSVLGGGLHAGFGALSDFLGRAAAETREGALRGSVAQMADGRDVDVSPVLASDPALQAGGPEAKAITDAANGITDARAQVEQARQGLDTAQANVEAATQALKVRGLTERTAMGAGGVDDVTLARLSDIQSELRKTIPAARRETLLQERDLIRGSIGEQSPELGQFLDQRDAAAEAANGAEAAHADATRRLQAALKDAQGADSRFRDLAVKSEGNVVTADREARRVGVDLGSDVRTRSASQRMAARIALRTGETEGIPADALAAEAKAQAAQVQQDGQARASDLIAKAKENTLAASRGDIPSSAVSPESSASAEADVREGRGDDLEADLANAQEMLAAYEKQGAITPEEAAEMKAALDGVKQADKFGEAAEAAARCLLLHP